MTLDHKNFGRLTEGALIVIGIGVAIAIAGIIAFSVLFALSIPWFTVPLIFVFLGTWIAARQWSELVQLRIAAGFVSSITHPTRITTASNLLNMKKHTFVHLLTKLITRGVVGIDIYPELDAFGPKGGTPPISIPKDYQHKTPIITSHPLTSGLQWIGLIGTIISMTYHIYGLLRYTGVLP
jgi:hypothetical protein